MIIAPVVGVVLMMTIIVVILIVVVIVVIVAMKNSRKCKQVTLSRGTCSNTLYCTDTLNYVLLYIAEQTIIRCNIEPHE